MDIHCWGHWFLIDYFQSRWQVSTGRFPPLVIGAPELSSCDQSINHQPIAKKFSQNDLGDVKCDIKTPACWSHCCLSLAFVATFGIAALGKRMAPGGLCWNPLVKWSMKGWSGKLWTTRVYQRVFAENRGDMPFFNQKWTSEAMNRFKESAWRLICRKMSRFCFSITWRKNSLICDCLRWNKLLDPQTHPTWPTKKGRVSLQAINTCDQLEEPTVVNDMTHSVFLFTLFWWSNLTYLIIYVYSNTCVYIYTYVMTWYII